jgi:GT2 family glycosyltransferase
MRNRLGHDVASAGPPGLYQPIFTVRGTPAVTIVVSDRDGSVDRLDLCVRYLRETTADRTCEIVVVPGIPTPGAVNAAIAGTRGDHFVILDAALDVETPRWIDEMVGLSQQSLIGAVGAKIQYADGRLRHVGLLIGVAPGVARAFHGYAGASYGHFSSAISLRNYSAVSGECVMTRREVFEASGGFDETLPWGVADVDYCLRIRQAAKRVVFTPTVRLRIRPDVRAAETITPAALERLREKWGEALDRDPYYNVNLSRASPNYQLDEE